jgi:hypothetical protein
MGTLVAGPEASRAECAAGVVVPLTAADGGAGKELFTDAGNAGGGGGGGGGGGVCWDRWVMFGLLDLRLDPKPRLLSFWNREFIKPAPPREH